MGLSNLLRGRARTVLALCGGLLLSGALLGGCGDDNNAAGPTAVSGTATKAVVDGATVTVHAINPDGTIGAIVAGPFTTGTDGTWSGALPAGQVGSFYVRVTGGSYVDEITMNTVNLGTDEMLGLLDTALGNTAAVTPFTHAMATQVQMAIGNGASPGSAVAGIVTAFTGLLGFDPMQVQPANPGNVPMGVGQNAGAYAALLGGLADAANQALISAGAVNSFEMALAVALDLADGMLDGMGPGGSPIMVADNTGMVAMPALDSGGLNVLISAMNAFAGAIPNLAGVTLPTTLVFPVIMPGGNGSVTGVLTLSGTGASAAGVTAFAPTLFTRVDAAGTSTLAFTGGVAGATVTVTISMGGVLSVNIVGLSLAAPAFNVTSIGGAVAGVTVSANSVQFTGVSVPQLGGANTLVVDGTLNF